jgi:alpha-beta hydrolase superfamily lysophospholipase
MSSDALAPLKRLDVEIHRRPQVDAACARDSRHPLAVPYVIHYCFPASACARAVPPARAYFVDVLLVHSEADRYGASYTTVLEICSLLPLIVTGKTPGSVI